MLKWLGSLTDSNEKEIKRLQPMINRINELEPELERLSDAELGTKTEEFKGKIKTGTSINDILSEAFAAVREAAKRTVGQRHYDVQLMGGIVLHQGKIAEMKTGEGKTLLATLPLYLNSLSGKGCHLATVNDYLARRDPYWMGPIYHKLGVSVASIYPMQTSGEHAPSRLYDPEYDSDDDRWQHFRPISRREAYEADIIYGTSSELGFDYLRDNMVVDLSQAVQRQPHYAIADEVDNLLIDEARTPLIISGKAGESSQFYRLFAKFVPRLRPNEDYLLDEKEKSVNLTDGGISNMERILQREGLLKSPDLYDPSNYTLTRYLDSALKSHTIYKRDRDYVVKDGQVTIVDEFTGRLMLGRRYSEGLHQAIEAKEHVKVQEESRTYASITIQNYFRMYKKLAGMTGTATTEAEEFHKIYNLDVVAIPTHRPMIRQDHSDQIYKDEKAKFNAITREIERMNKKGRPVLIGTVSIEKSERLSDLLKRKGIPYQVLNAKQHEKEAHIIARAGEPGAVTVATNMAGRGVDIVLGGNKNGQADKDWQQQHDKVIGLGGLHVLGTERHEARRIDNQLRGRSGRQGDPGSSRFFVSLEDDVVRRFGGDRVKGILGWAGLDENTPIENKLVNRSIESAQVRVEGYHFDIRKHLVEYDDVVNQQRELIYNERRKILSGADLKANILTMIKDEIKRIVATYAPNQGYDWDAKGLMTEVSTIFPLPSTINDTSLLEMKATDIEDKLTEYADTSYEQRETEVSPDGMRVMERLIMLRILDSLWVEHLTAMEQMRLEAGWQTLRQVRAVDAYKKEGYKQFELLLSTIQHDVAHTVFHVNLTRKEGSQARPDPQKITSPMAQIVSPGNDKPGQHQKVAGKKIGRNEPCPCGSAKKYKHCHGR